jgi:Ni,Fe-hydrogenase III large subunit
MAGSALLAAFPGEPVSRAAVPRLAFADLASEVLAGVARGARVAALFGHPAGDGIEIVAILGDPREGVVRIGTAAVGEAFPSLTPACPQVHLFEREIAEQWGVRPEGHPWPKPVRFHGPYRAGAGAPAAAVPAIGITDFYRLDGAEVHEVAVGPVHAGVIEPGHFRFSCHGEDVHHLEISLGYQHRGVERALAGGPSPRTIHLVETAAGDTSIAHATAYCQNLEALSGCVLPPRAETVRGIALELERMANHVGDLGALAGDVAFLPTASYCGRLRGDLLNITALLCGSRFGRGVVRPGGVRFDLDDGRAAEVLRRLDAALRDIREAAELMFAAPSVQGRFEGTGALTRAQAVEIGLVGVAARACGLELDSRLDFPSGIYRFAQVPVSSWDTGDVFSRAWVRWLEVQRSAAFIREQLASMPAGDVRVASGPLAANSLAVAIVAGWRGEVCHVAITGPDRRLARYKVIDPSFHNWFGLALALRGQAISDFPLCNKSFNLSYCGHDL